MNINKYEPLWRQVLVSPVVVDTTESGIILSEKETEVYLYEVKAVGEEVLKVKVGEKVTIDKFGISNGALIPFDDEGNLLQVNEQQIIGRCK